MLNRKVKKVILTLGMSLAIVSLASGCDKLKKPQETESETEKKTEKITEAPTETEKETEPQKNIAFQSKDGSIQITLPDSTWKVTQDADEMRVFSSGAAMISIVHKAGENNMKNLSVAESEEALKESLTKQYGEANEADAFEVVKFEKKTAGTLNTYEYTVKYNSTSMWTYAVTYGIIAEKEAYVISGTVTDDNAVLLKAVQDSVESFTVLNNSLFAVTPGDTTAQPQSETTQSESAKSEDEELKTLQDYGTSATLYANDNVNIRVTPSTESNENIMGSLNKGDQVTVVGETSQWFKVNINGNICYVNKAFLVKNPVSATESTDNNNTDSDSQTPVHDDTKQEAELNSYIDYGTSYTLYTTTEVNVRSKPGTDSSQVDTLGSGEAITVVGETDNWFAVSVNGSICYISKSYVSSDNSGGSYDGDTGSDGNTGGDSGNTGGDTGSSTGGNTGGDDVGTISGTVTSASVNGIVIAGDDGNTYSINTMDASISTEDGIAEGVRVNVGVNYSNTLPNGDLYATSVTSY